MKTKKITTISVKKETKQRLEALRKVFDSYDELINTLLDVFEK